MTGATPHRVQPWLDDGDLTLAYLGGIVDGEGYIGVKRTGRRYHARLQVGMVERHAIDVLRETFGGSLTIEQHGRLRPIHRWHVSDRQAEQALRSLLPYLRVKRDQAIVVLGLRDFQREERQHRTKVVGERQFPNQHGAVRTIPNLAHSDEYVALCHGYYERCRLLNRVGGGDANE